jgi:hypothetical protein
VIDEAVADFVAAYGADGDWARLFAHDHLERALVEATRWAGHRTKVKAREV